MTGVAVRIAVVVVIAAAALPALLASAAPSRSAALYQGPGFDTCSAPSTKTMQSWLASPYRAVGIYIGGVNRACPDGNLSPAWVAGVVAGGWNLLPLYVGLQAPCVGQAGLALINPSTATADGSASADDAVARAGAFGLAPGSPIYFDMEGYKGQQPGVHESGAVVPGGMGVAAAQPRLPRRRLRQRRLDDPRPDPVRRQSLDRPRRRLDRELERPDRRLRRPVRRRHATGRATSASTSTRAATTRPTPASRSTSTATRSMDRSPGRATCPCPRLPRFRLPSRRAAR